MFVNCYFQCLNQKRESISLKNDEDGEHAQREKAKLLMQKVSF